MARKRFWEYTEKLVSLIKKKCREQFQELPEWLK